MCVCERACEFALSTANKCTKHAKIMRAYCPNLFSINFINKKPKKGRAGQEKTRNFAALVYRRTNPDLHGLASGCSAFDGAFCWVLGGCAGTLLDGCCRKAKELCLARDKAINSVRNLI